MEWTDNAIVLGLRRHGESSAVLEAMTARHGRHLGLVRAARGPRLSPVLQPGNSVTLTWRARLEDHLGVCQIEPARLRAGGFFGEAAALYALGHLTGLMRLLPEREPHEGLHAALEVTLDHLNEPLTAAALLARLELALLAELGFGLDLSACAATGATQELIYVSPKSGRAVSARAGAPYADRLLRLPAFLRAEGTADGVDAHAARDALALTAHFLLRDIYEPRRLPAPQTRADFIAAALARA